MDGHGPRRRKRKEKKRETTQKQSQNTQITRLWCAVQKHGRTPQTS